MNLIQPYKKSAFILLLFFVMGSQPQDLPFPEEWYAFEREDYNVFVDRQVKNGGKASCCIKTVVPKPTQGAMLWQVLSAEEYKGKRLRMSAFVKTDDIKSIPRDGGVWLFISTHSDKKRNLTNDSMLTRKILGTTDWTKHALIVDVPESAQLIHFGMAMRGPGQAWFDDFHFQIVGKEVPTTGGEIGPSDSGVGEIRKDLPKRPRNPDFENGQD